MAPLPPRPSWVTVTDLPEPPCGYGSPLAPWRPAGRKSLTQSQVFLNQAPLAPSRPSSAPSTAVRATEAPAALAPQQRVATALQCPGGTPDQCHEWRLCLLAWQAIPGETDW